MHPEKGFFGEILGVIEARAEMPRRRIGSLYKEAIFGPGKCHGSGVLHDFRKDGAHAFVPPAGTEGKVIERFASLNGGLKLGDITPGADKGGVNAKAVADDVHEGGEAVDSDTLLGRLFV